MTNSTSKIRWRKIVCLGSRIYYEWPKDILGRSVSIRTFPSDADALAEAQRIGATILDPTARSPFGPHTVMHFPEEGSDER